MKLLWRPSNHTAMLLICTLVMAGALLIYATGVPVGNLAPFAMLIVCPLMHVLMMRGHGSSGSRAQAPCHGTETAPARATGLEQERVVVR